MRHFFHILTLSFSLLCACACGKPAASQAENTKTDSAPAPAARFDADSAYAHITAQVAFGPRVPGSEAAERCGDWISGKLRQYGAHNVTEQRAQVTAYNGDKLNIRNISAQYAPEAPQRILLLAHWDSRPWADQEPDAADRDKPIDGANDGASGVGVILEMARQMAKLTPKVGVDILLVDAEDYGRRSDDTDASADDDTWCLGTQYWAEHPTLPLESISYAVLLDMVGGKDAVFPREQISDMAAPQVVDFVWKTAKRAGQAARFPNRRGGAVMDDHVYLLRAGIPAIDIIESAHPATGSFPPYWHTHADNIDNIDRATLAAVGSVLSALAF